MLLTRSETGRGLRHRISRDIGSEELQRPLRPHAEFFDRRRDHDRIAFGQRNRVAPLGFDHAAAVDRDEDLGGVFAGFIACGEIVRCSSTRKDRQLK